MAEQQRTSPLLTAVLILVCLNIGLTAVAITRTGRASKSTQTATGLPAYLNQSALAAIATSVQQPFNANDTVALYRLMDPLARTQVTEADLANSVEHLRQLLGRVVELSYTGHEKGTFGDYPAYVLYYKARYSGGGFQSGTVKLSVIDRGDHVGIVGFKMDAN